MEKIIIATVAQKGAGKGLFIEIMRKLLPDKKIAALRFSDTWRQILHILAKDESRENMSQLATAIRTLFGDDGILVGAMQRRMAEIDGDIIILDGLRKSEEVDPLVRKNNGVLVSITASAKVRFERRRIHAETTDEVGMSWKQFMHQESIATETSIKHIGQTMADAVIPNDGTVQEFEKNIQAFLTAHVLPKL